MWTLRLSPGARRWGGRAAVLALLVATLLAYLPSLGNEFAMDDRFLAKAVLDDGRSNAMVAELRPVGDYFSSNYWRVTGPGRLYRPVTVLSYALTYRFLVPEGAGPGREALPHHLINVLLHLGAVLGVFALVRGVTGRGLPAWIGAAVFGLHAIHSEVVAGVVGRAELFAFDFGAAAVLVVAAAAGGGGVGRTLRRGLAGLLLFAAFCSKESALAWLPFLAVYLLARSVAGTPRPAGGLGRVLGRSAVEAVVVGVLPLGLFLYLRARMLSALPELPAPNFIANPLAFVAAAERWWTAVEVQGYGLFLTLFPFRLAADYGPAVFRVVTRPDDLGFLAAAAALGGLLVLSLRALGGRPLLFLAGTTFLGFGFLTSNLPFATGTIFAERLYYAPSLGLSFACAWVWGRLPGRSRWGVAAGAATAAWVAGSAIVILGRNPVWKDNETLFFHEVATQPSSARMHAAVAAILRDRRDLDGAIRHLRQAVALAPEYAGAWNNLGQVLLRSARLDAAERALERGLATKRADRQATAELYCNLGFVHALRGETAAAIDAFRASLRGNEAFTRARVELLNVGLDGLAPAELEEILARGRRIDPSNPHWPLYRALIDHRRGDWARARRGLERALADFPPFGELSVTRLVLGDCLARLGEKAEALRVLDRLAADPSARSDVRARARRYADGLRKQD